MKKIIVVLDGAADLPSPLLEGKTPLAAAYKPNLDFFASEGKNGYMFSIKENVAPESDAAIMSLLGYDPYKYFTGRGPLETYGFGIKLSLGDLALRCNFATAREKEIVDRRAGRTLTTKEARILEKTINKKIKMPFPFVFRSTLEHRGILVFRGGFSDNITNTDPAYEKTAAFGVAKKSNLFEFSKPIDEEEITETSANLVNSFIEQSRKILQEHPINIEREKKGLLPANIILTRDAGIKLPELPKKREKWLAILALPMEKAIAKLAGMDIAEFDYPKIKSTDVYKHVYDCLNTEIKYSKKFLKKKLKKYDCFYIHLKQFDVAGHDGLAEEKKKMLEIVDREFFSFLRTLKDVLIVVTCDHSTPCILKMHSSDFVPLLIYGKEKDSVQCFSEKECVKGSMGKIYGKEMLSLLE